MNKNLRSPAKIISLDHLAKLLRQHREEGQTVALCHGCFDLLHPGHIKHFEEAATFADILVVTVTPDEYVDKGPGRPVFTQQIRLETIAAIGCVDYVALNRWPTAEETIRLLRPDFFVKGSEFENKPDPSGKLQREQAIMAEVGCQMRYTHIPVVFSSTQLLRDMFDFITPEMQKFLTEFRQVDSLAQLDTYLETFRKLRITVIGETIIDEYHYVSPEGKSPKANVITSRYLRQTAGLGGALCIANHLSDFCGHVNIITTLGRQQPNWEEAIRRQLPANVSLRAVFCDDRPTIVKRRYIEPVFLEKLFEVHFYNDAPLSSTHEQQVLDTLSDCIEQSDLLIISDFGHGMMTPAIIDAITSLSLFRAATIQTNSTNFGFNPATRYRNLDFISIDERELRLAMQDKFTPVSEIAPRLMHRLQTPIGAITLGKNGSAIFDQHQRLCQVPVLSQHTKDPIGAGDAFFALASLAAKLKAPATWIAFLGNAAGALAANIIGNDEAIKAGTYRKFAGGLLQ
ncbi:MAG: hypothetical protein D6820_16310 [Lentisphaerae bacterium]|nr:MAG: hypothetical protein D6820_16310 [Lentisphaerota bacterium]